MQNDSWLMEGDCLEKMKEILDNSVDSLVCDPPAGISFMGKDWDDDKGGRDAWISWLSTIMRECLRILKPGGHGLVWAIPRTSHWTGKALEDAGFEIRDCITHLFGTGFPKSLDISKALDKEAGAEREVVGTYDPRSQYDNCQRTESDKGQYFEGTINKKVNINITIPATEAAKQWSGFGTSLKPASEFWWLIRKPLSEKTVAKNVVKHGTGGINIDECRISLEEGDKKGEEGELKGNYSSNGFFGNSINDVKNTSQGRFPANLVLSHNDDCLDEKCTEECAVKMLDEQSGILKSGTLSPKNNVKANSGWSGGSQANRVKNTFVANSGSASRFFYCAKASKSDKGKNNNHPTIKATKLMEYLIKLITPPNGIVIDPFMGSGSTGVAAIRLEFGFIGIEKEENYFQIAQERIGEAILEKEDIFRSHL